MTHGVLSTMSFAASVVESDIPALSRSLDRFGPAEPPPPPGRAGWVASCQAPLRPDTPRGSFGLPCARPTQERVGSFFFCGAHARRARTTR